MARRGRPPHPDVLTPREWQVLELIREGLSNPEIATRLGISRDGAKYHVSEILTKLGVSTREEAAAWRPEERRPERRPWWAALGLPRALGADRIASVLAGIVVLVALAGLVLIALLLGRGDGGVASVNQLAYVDADGALWLVNADGSGRKMLAEPGACNGFGWAPTGERIVCFDGEASLVIIDQHGDRIGSVNVLQALSFEWSPTGRAFSLGTEDSLIVLSDSGETIAELPWPLPAREDGDTILRAIERGDAQWSLDGDKIAYRLPDGTHIHTVSTGVDELVASDVTPLSWVLGDAALLVSANRGPVEFNAVIEFEANVLDLSTGSMRRVPQLDDSAQHWSSPDGSWAAVITRSANGSPDGLASVDFATGASARATSWSSQMIVRSVDILNDGSTVYTTVRTEEDPGSSIVYIGRPDDLLAEEIVELRGVLPQTSPDGDAIAYVKIDVEALYVSTIDGRREVEVTAFNPGGPQVFMWRPGPD